MKRNTLFRQAASEAQQTKWLGDIVLVRPLSFTFLTIFAVTLAAIVICYLVAGTYTKRTTVSGQLIPNKGLIKVYASQPGIVQEKLVTEGQKVKRGDVLYVLSSERQSSRANCKTIFLNCPASRKRNFQLRFGDAGRLLID